MNIKAWLNERVEGMILGQLAAKLDSGGFGPRAQAIYRAGKGYLTWTSAGIGIVAVFATQIDATGASDMVARASAVLAGLGLARKGAHLEPPDIPPAMRDALEIGGSVVTWLLMLAQGVVVVAQTIGAPWAMSVSGSAQFAVLLLAAVSGFLATWAAPAVPLPEKGSPS